MSQISRLIDEHVKRATNVIVFNLQEQSNESDKNTIMNLCKFIVDRMVTCKLIRLGKKEEGKIRPVKIVFPDVLVKNSFMKNLNELKNPPDQFKNLSIKHDMTVDERKNEGMLQDIANEKNTSSNKDSKKLRFCSEWAALGLESCKIKTKDKSGSITSTDKQLKIWFTNYDVFNISKQQELCSRVATNSPDIICLLEVKPKNFSRTLSLVEYKVDGYLLEQCNILLDSGRGMLFYIKNNIRYQKLDISSIPNTNLSEIITVKLMLKENIRLACVSAHDNSNVINKSLENLSRRFCSNLLVVGDFNYPKIDWEHYPTSSSPNDLNSKFLECTRDCFFEQFISEPTRGRGSSQPTLIDLVLTLRHYRKRLSWRPTSQN